MFCRSPFSNPPFGDGERRKRLKSCFSLHANRDLRKTFSWAKHLNEGPERIPPTPEQRRTRTRASDPRVRGGGAPTHPSVVGRSGLFLASINQDQNQDHLLNVVFPPPPPGGHLGGGGGGLRHLPRLQDAPRPQAPPRALLSPLSGRRRDRLSARAPDFSSGK